MLTPYDQEKLASPHDDPRAIANVRAAEAIQDAALQADDDVQHLLDVACEADGKAEGECDFDIKTGLGWFSVTFNGVPAENCKAEVERRVAEFRVKLFEALAGEVWG